MKQLKLFFALFAMLALGVTNAWAATYSMTPNKAGTGLSNTSYITTLTEFTINGVTWKMNQWNPSTLQIKTNQSSAASEWRFYNTTAIPGKITKVVIKFSALTLKNTSASGFKFVGGSSEVTATTGGTDGVWDSSAKTLTWTPGASDEFTYFALYQNGKVASGTNNLATSDAIVVTYENSSSDETEVTDDQLAWSATSAEATLPSTFDNQPSLINTLGLDVTYSSSTPATATIDATTGAITLVGVGTTTIKATFAGGEVGGTKYAAKMVSYNLTVKPAPLVIEPIEGGIIDILTHSTLGVTATSYTSFSGKQATNDNHSNAVYAGKTARNGSATQYNIQLNTGKGGIATTTTGGLAKRVYVKWASQTANTDNRALYIYGSNTAYTGSETSTSTTKIGTVTYTTGAEEAYADLTGDYQYILILASGAIYMDEIHVTWVSAAGTVVTPTISGEAEFVESTEVSIATETGYKVYYTLDGTDPTNASTEYTAPFTVNTTTTVKAIAYDGTSASDVVSATFKALEILTCAEAAALCATTESADKYVIRGYVTSIPYPYNSETNKTPTFWMADTKDGGNVMQAYKVTPLEEADKAVIVGDQVEVIGKIKLYSETPEVNGGTYTITVPNPKYNVKITSAHGTVTATPASAVAGTEITLSVEVESGWVFQNWTVTDASSNNIEVTDNKFTMPASDVTVVANYNESTAADAVLTLMANGKPHSQVTYKQGEKAKLPATIENDCLKIFVGWSANANCAVAPEYAPGADFELTAEEHTLYAVYANGTTGETVTIKHNVPTTGTSTNMTGNNDANKFFGLDAAAWSIVAAKGGASNNVGINKDGTIRLYYAAAGGNTLTITAPSKVATIKLTYNGTYTNAWVKVNGNKVTPTDGVYTIDAETFVIGNANTTNVQVHIKNIAVTLAGALDNFSTTCTGALAAPTFSVAEGTYTEAQSITLSAAAEGIIYYTLDGKTPTASSEKYTTPIVLDVCGEYTIKAIVISSDNESPVASATYKMDLDIATGSVDAPLTTTEARAIYEGDCYNNEYVYVTGIVESADFYSSSNTYTITLKDGFQFYKFYEGADNDPFETDYIKKGDELVAYGQLGDYNGNCQLVAGCYLVSYKQSETELTDISNTKETAYTVEQAQELTDGATNDLSKAVYVKGIVSQIVTAYSEQYGNISYNISTDGSTTSKQLQAYRGVSYNGDKFTSANDILVGDEVIIYGKLDKYNSSYQLAAGNQLVSLVRTQEPTPEPETPTITPTATFIFNTADGLSKLGITYPAADGGSGALMTEFEDGASYTQDGITMTTTDGTSTVTRVWQAASGALDLRIYKGATLTLSVGKDLVISNVVFTGKNITNLKVDNEEVDNNSWAGSKQSVTFDVAGTTYIYTIAITVSYTRSISANYGTICLPYGSSNYSGAEFYEFVGKETGKVWLASVDKLEAGVPYVFKVKGTQLTVAYEGTPVSDPGKHNGLYGTFTDNTPVEKGYYIISQGKVLAPCGTGCYVNANRAYVVMEDIKGDKPTQQMPGRRYIGMDVQGENVETGVEDLFTTDAPVKVIENGQLIIIRDGVKYNVQGQKL